MKNMNNLNSKLASLYDDYEKLRVFSLQRKKETEELMILLKERAEAEKAYAERLIKIAEKNKKTIDIGRSGEAVTCFRAACKVRGK